MSLAPKLDHKLRCKMEQVTNPVEGQFDGQETAVTHGRLHPRHLPRRPPPRQSPFGHYGTKAIVLPHYNASPPAIPMSSYRSSPSSLSRERRIMPTDPNKLQNYTTPPPVAPDPELLPLNDPNLPWDRFEAFCEALISRLPGVKDTHR